METPPLRLSMTLPGSASLGAFQAGAMAGVAVGVLALRRCGRSVHLDAVGGSSAGAIVSVLATHALLSGRDAPTLLRRAWVDEVDVGLLRSGGRHAPLGFDELRSRFHDFLGDEDRHPRDVHEPLSSPVTVQIGLTGLLGLTTRVPTAGTESSALSYADFAEFELTPGSPRDEILEPSGASPLDAMIASASHPGAFAPRVLDRSGRRGDYEARGVTNFPASGRLWYTDGGLVERQPIGRVLAAARRRSGNAEGTRLHVVVDPRGSGPSGDAEWRDVEDSKSWVAGVRRSLSVLPTQALHDDLRGVASVNRRLDAVRRLADDLGSTVADDHERDELRRRLAEAADVTGKELVNVEMISPLLLATDDRGVADLLAGDFIGAFGGFLSRRVRRSDYQLGWRAASTWIPDALTRHGCRPDEIEHVHRAMTEHLDDELDEVLVEADGVDALSNRERLQLAALAAATGYQLFREAVPTPSLPGRQS
jgi:predicted acylesterase/phospholipase RssA